MKIAIQSLLRSKVVGINEILSWALNYRNKYPYNEISKSGYTDWIAKGNSHD